MLSLDDKELGKVKNFGCVKIDNWYWWTTMDAETLTRRLAIDDDCGDFCSTIGNGSWCKILVDLTFSGGHLENHFYVVGSLMSILSTRDKKSIILNL